MKCKKCHKQINKLGWNIMSCSCEYGIDEDLKEANDFFDKWKDEFR